MVRPEPRERRFRTGCSPLWYARRWCVAQLFPNLRDDLCTRGAPGVLLFWRGPG
jgi:hypothetical protein